MRYVRLGKTGEDVPVIGMGTWKLGNDERKEAEVLKIGVRLGMRLIDTAEAYGTEPLVSKAIKGESGIFIATKVWPTHLRYNDVIMACNASLKKLGVNCIDLYQIHWPNAKVPIKETMRAMERLVDEGKIRYIGVSNFSVTELEEAQATLKGTEIASNQVEYNLLTRNIERNLLKYCGKEKITVIAYSPLARGLLFEKRYSELLDLLASIGRKRGKSAAQVALNWLISKGNVIAIPKASTKKHARENAGAGNFSLGKSEVKAIDAFSARMGKAPLTEEFRPRIDAKHELMRIAGLHMRSFKRILKGS